MDACKHTDIVPADARSCIDRLAIFGGYAKAHGEPHQVHSGQAQVQAGDFHNRFAVAIHQGIGHGEWLRAEANLLDGGSSPFRICFSK
jgi:hypothetical protein